MTNNNSIYNNNNINEYNCLKENKTQDENTVNVGDNVVVVKKNHKNENTTEDGKKIEYFKRRIEELTREYVVDEVLREYLKEPESEENLKRAMEVYNDISRVILEKKDIQNPVGLLFYIARNNIRPPKESR